MSRTELIVHPRFVESAAALQKPQQTRLWKQLDLLVKNPDHPSLGRKLVKGARERVWEIRLDQSYRVIYEERNEQIPFLLLVANHDEALRFAQGWMRQALPQREIEMPLRSPRASPSIEIPMHLDFAGLRAAVDGYKYRPLTEFLKTRKESSVRLRFTEIANLLCDSLPSSARTHRAWWGNNDNRHVQARAWLSAGRRVVQLSLSEGWVEFSL
jgi:mRNA-degrading endonuclease RelE of RelBE toxin-antitoxin system